MASPGVVAPALLLPIPVISLALSLYNSRSTPAKPAVLLFLAILAAVASATALSVACGEPLGVVARVFASLLHVTLCGVSIYALTLSSQTPVSFLTFFLSLATLLIACELVSTLIPTSPRLLPATLALVSRALLLSLAIVTATLLHRRRVAFAARMNTEKGHLTDEPHGKTLGRVSSPTQATWPFPGSIALQAKSSPANQSTPPHVVTTFPRAHDANQIAYQMDRYTFLPLILVNAQLFSTLSAGLNVAVSILERKAISRSSQALPHVLLASAACTLLWSFTTLAVIQILPAKPKLCYSERQMTTGYEQGPLRVSPNTLPRGNPVHRTPKRSLSRGESDSMLDFLSLRDPFASSPPPPPPLPPIGLGLEEVDVGWNGSKEIGMQYRFPAPRSIVRGGRRKGKGIRGNGKKRLAHQNSSRTLLSVPEIRGTEVDVERERGFGDEARLAQLLLQSLNEAASEEDDSPNAPTPVPTVTPPQPAHIQQSSRWSTGTTIQSIVSGSVSNRSGVSTYTTCASEKVPTSRISMNTIASVLGSRKSSEAKRKSAMTASSSKG